MEDMRRTDYEAIRALDGLVLRKYDYPGRWWEYGLTWFEWNLIVAEWVVCGAVGIITGIISWLWDFVELAWDIVKIVWHLLWSLVYALSGGGAGSDNWLVVKDFFRGIGMMFDQPGKLIDQALEDIALQFRSIEGPLTDCFRAEFVVRKFVYTLINVVLFVKGLVGAAKKVGKAVGRFSKGAPTPPKAPSAPSQTPQPAAKPKPSIVAGVGLFSDLGAARQWAADALALSQGILANLTLDAINRLLALPEWAIQKIRPLAMATKRWLLGCESPCKVDVDAILQYLNTLTQAAKAGAKPLNSIQDILAAIPPTFDKTMIAAKLQKHPVYLLAIQKAKLTDVDLAAMAKFWAPADMANPKTAYQTFTRYITSIVPVRIGPDVKEFNDIMALMVAQQPRVAAALKGPMWETFAKVHLGRFRNIRFGRATFQGQGLSKARTSDGFIESAQALWDFKHTADKVPADQAQDYLKILTQGLKSTDGKTVRSVNYLFPTEEAAKANKHLQGFGFKVYYVTPPNTVSLLP
jgi:hypothetical protein